MLIDPASLEALRSLFLGFAFSGLLASAYQLVAGRPVSFSLLRKGDARALASAPVLVFSAPLIILRNTIRGRRIERRPVAGVVVATVIAGCWSILCGRLVLDAAAYLAGA